MIENVMRQRIYVPLDTGLDVVSLTPANTVPAN
jgi:hypothetical protein